MTKDPTFAEGKGTPAKQSTPESKVQSKVQSKAQSKVKVKEKAVALAAAALLTLPLLAVPSRATAQSKAGGDPGAIAFLVLRLPGTYTVLGEGQGHTILAGPDGKPFFLDPTTGDKKFVVADYFLKLGDVKRARKAKVFRHKDASPVFVVGADDGGNTVMMNVRSQTFILDPKTGDVVFIKWPK